MSAQSATSSDVGAAQAAMLSAAIGCATLGIMVILAMASEAWKQALDWWAPVGPLSGKTSVAVLVWLVTWAILSLRWRTSAPSFRSTWWWTLLGIAVGFLGTFPPVFELFHHAG